VPRCALSLTITTRLLLKPDGLLHRFVSIARHKVEGCFISVDSLSSGLYELYTKIQSDEKRRGREKASPTDEECIDSFESFCLLFSSFFLFFFFFLESTRLHNQITRVKEYGRLSAVSVISEIRRCANTDYCGT